MNATDNINIQKICELNSTTRKGFLCEELALSHRKPEESLHSWIEINLIIATGKTGECGGRTETKKREWKKAYQGKEGRTFACEAHSSAPSSCRFA